MSRRPEDLGLAPAYDEERVAATWQRIARSRADRRRPMTPVLAFAAAAALGMVVAALLIGRGGEERARPAPGALVGREPVMQLDTGAVIAQPIVLDDSSRVELADGARLHVLGNDGTQFMTLLEGGAARFEVTPGGPRRWTIETALATIEVAGTVFRLDLTTERLVVSVEHGAVLVRGDKVPGRIVRLGSGERLEISDATAAAEPPPSPTVPVPVPVPVPDPVPVPKRVPAPSVAVAGPGPSLTDVLAEADRLRAAGQHAEAADLLERAVAAAPDDPAAGLASFTVGRLALDVLAQPDRAAAAFARVIERGRPSSLLEDAHLRRAEALIRAGRRDDAAAALDAYQLAFPEGRRAAALRARLDEP